MRQSLRLFLRFFFLISCYNDSLTLVFARERPTSPQKVRKIPPTIPFSRANMITTPIFDMRGGSTGNGGSSEKRQSLLDLATKFVSVQPLNSIHLPTLAGIVVLQTALAIIQKFGTTSSADETTTPEPQNTSQVDKKDLEELLERVQNLIFNVEAAMKEDSLWTKIIHKDGVTVWRSDSDVKNYLHRKEESAVSEADQHSTIRSEAVLNAPPSDVYRLFMDPDRVHEYNENCAELEDTAILSPNAKISWSATGKIGPFAPRDFVTLVTFRDCGPKLGYMSLSTQIQHPTLAPLRKGYVRSQIQLSATYFIPLKGKPNQTKFVQITQIGQMGGVADSKLGKRITKNLVEKAPVDFIKKFERAVLKGGVEKV